MKSISSSILCVNDFSYFFRFFIQFFGFSVSLKCRSFVRVTKVLIRLNLTITMILEPSLTHSLTFDFLGSIDPAETWITKNQWCVLWGNRQYMRRRWEIPINFNPLHLKRIYRKCVHNAYYHQLKSACDSIFNGSAAECRVRFRIKINQIDSITS